MNVAPSLPNLVAKRNGEVMPYRSEKILSAIRRAGEATDEYGVEEAQSLLMQVEKTLGFKYAKSIPTVEKIQDVVEQVLLFTGKLKTARAYIVYREQHARLRDDKRTFVDVEQSMNEYLTRSDWRVNANANQGYSLGGLILNVAGKVTANYWLSHVYPPEIGEAHREADLHIHDLDMFSGYCAGWSLRNLLQEGLNGIPGRVMLHRLCICHLLSGR